MKNNKITKNKYKKRKIAIISIIAIILLCLITLITKSNIQKIAQNGYEYTVSIGKENINISNVITTEPNTPIIGAGMIPIKWNETTSMWEITTTQDSDWYDYSKGLCANMMLNDGYYKSELEVGISNEQLAKNNIGVGIPNDSEYIGTIYTWVPRLMYNETNVEYLKPNCLVEYEWTTPTCFTYTKQGLNDYDLSFTGMWVAKENDSNVWNKTSNMNLEENNYGFIKNELATVGAEEERIVVEKLNQKLGIQNETTINNWKYGEYRQIIRIVNTNSYSSITTRHDISAGTIIFKTIYKENSIRYILDEEGNILSTSATGEAERDIDSALDQYTFYVVDTQGNIKKHSFTYILSGKPDLTGFNLSNTFYVVYNEDGYEDSSIPIGEKIPKGWYNYDNQQWANIVVRNNGSEAYYTWIPRYMYKIDEEKEQTIDAKIVDLDNKYTDPDTGKGISIADEGYKLPEAFRWNGTNIKGFWTSKYELREASTTIPEIYGGGELIRVNNIIATYGANYTYEMYLINKDGKRIIWSEEEKEYVEGTDYIDLKAKADAVGNYLFKNVPVGDYVVNIIVKDSSGIHIKAIAQTVTVIEKVEMNPPDLTGFNKNLTFYVTYDENGTESSYIPIGTDAPDNWYDYDAQQWANIVVRNEGNEAYYTWIPRYEYKLDEANQKTIAQIIPVTQTRPDTGYQIPEAFKWAGTNIKGFWTSKYELRDLTTTRLYATVAADETKVRVSNIIPLDTTSTTFKISLIQEGKVLQEVSINTNTEHTFDITDTGPGTYSVSVTQTDSTGTVIAGFAKEFIVYALDPPDVTGYMVDTTYIVTYDESGNADETQTLRSVLKDGASINSSGALSSGQIDLSKIKGTWYDYSKQIWANIVTKNNSKTAYFVWIPRYEYITNSTEQRVSAILIPKSKTSADAGYQIPEAFKWNNTNISGFWVSKYELRS